MTPRLLPFLFAGLALAAPAARAAAAAVLQPTIITCQQRAELQSSPTETTFVLTGLVTVEATNMKLTCDRLEIVALRSVKELSVKGNFDPDKFKSLVAIGRVRIEQLDRIATCGRAEVLPQENLILLTENPMVQDGESTMTGDRIKLLRGERQGMIVEGPVRMIGAPIKDLSAEKKPGGSAEKKP